MSISPCICAQVQEERDIRAIEEGHRRNPSEIVRTERGKIIEACPDHIHMLVSIPPYLSIAQFTGYLKGKSSLMIFD